MNPILYHASASAKAFEVDADVPVSRHENSSMRVDKTPTQDDFVTFEQDGNGSKKACADRDDASARAAAGRTFAAHAGLSLPVGAKTDVCSNCAGMPVNYAPSFVAGFDPQDRPVVALRSFWQRGRAHALVVDIDTLQTQVILRAAFRARREVKHAYEKHYLSLSRVEQSPYGQTRSRYIQEPQLMQNAGLQHGDPKKGGLFLTVDLCPSIKAFERSFFDALCARGQQDQRRMPVALCVSAMWMDAHEQDMDWLLEQHRDQLLDITWVNHSFSHAYQPDREMAEANFLLAPGVNLLHEIYETERMLIAKGAIPSVFFRFPGLVADKRTLKELYRVGLVPLAKNAWLAQGDPVRPADVVLVHGNGMEPEGIAAARPLLGDTTWRPIAEAALDLVQRQPEVSSRTLLA